MGNEVYSGALAVGLGVLVGIALFVPFVALSYRRRGGLPAPWNALQLLFAGTAIVLLFTTRAGRGLPGVLSGRQLADAREPVPHPSRVRAGSTGSTGPA